MKPLIISIKTSTEALNDFGKAYKKIQHGKLKASHYEISFDSKKDFDRFTSNLHILSNILAFKPKSVYELAKISKMDVSNLNKIMTFFESIDAIRLETSVVSGRTVKTPVVDYDRIEFNLAA